MVKDALNTKMWAARDMAGELWLYTNKPVHDGDFWCTHDISEGMIQLPQELLPELLFENSPIEVNMEMIITH